MKKIRLILCLCLLIAVLLPVTASATEIGYFTDDANLIIFSNQQSQLEQRAKELSDRYDCGVYIVTVYDYSAYGSSVYDAACNIFLNYNYGYGDEGNGVMLLLSMRYRDYTLISHGTYGNYIFTDYSKDKVEDAFLDDFHDDDWYGGFKDYLNACERCMAAAENGKPLDASNDPSTIPSKVLIAFGISAVIALIVCMSMKGKMKSVHKGASATQYMVTNGAMLSIADDVYTHTTTTRRTIERSSSSSGSRSGGSGFSGHSGKF